MATSRKRTTPKKDEPRKLLDLRDLVGATPVVTSIGTFKMRNLSVLSPKERFEVLAAQEYAEDLQAQEAPESMEEMRAVLKAAEEAEDKILSCALFETDRETRDRLSGPERGALIAAFFGASDEEAKAVVRAAMNRLTSIGEKPSPDSSDSTDEE